MGLSATSVQWRDLTFATGDGALYRALAVEGWEELPPNRYDKINRARGHGSHSSAVWADERIVTVEGWTWSQDDRDQAVADLMGRFTFDGGEEPLTITLAGRTLTASAQLLRAAPTLAAGQWGVGRFAWMAQWRCPDPLRYGPESSVSTGLPTSGGGLAWPLFSSGVLDWGPPGSPGQVTVSNDGTADAGIVFDITGGLPQGWEVSALGGRITYPVPVPAGQAVTVDTAAGTVLVEGTADRRGELTNADWLLVPAGSSLTLQFTSLGGAFDPGASLTARWRPANW